MIYLCFFSLELGVDIKEVQELVERHLQDMIVKYFDPKKADSIFTDEGEVMKLQFSLYHPKPSPIHLFDLFVFLDPFMVTRDD